MRSHTSNIGLFRTTCIRSDEVVNVPSLKQLHEACQRLGTRSANTSYYRFDEQFCSLRSHIFDTRFALLRVYVRTHCPGGHLSWWQVLSFLLNSQTQSSDVVSVGHLAHISACVKVLAALSIQPQTTYNPVLLFHCVVFAFSRFCGFRVVSRFERRKLKRQN